MSMRWHNTQPIGSPSFYILIVPTKLSFLNCEIQLFVCVKTNFSQAKIEKKLKWLQNVFSYRPKTIGLITEQFSLKISKNK